MSNSSELKGDLLSQTMGYPHNIQLAMQFLLGVTKEGKLDFTYLSAGDFLAVSTEDLEDVTSGILRLLALLNSTKRRLEAEIKVTPMRHAKMVARWGEIFNEEKLKIEEAPLN